jgi:uncharacterized protein (DUF433 family)
MNFERITRDPRVMGGKPCIRGTRVTVGTILGLLSGGAGMGEVLRDYDYLTEADIRAALGYAAWLAGETESELLSA